ncbi:MAG: PEGA domain-containing protein, partial [Terriglobales bacterium]
AQTPTPAAAPASNDDKPRIFITDSESWEVSGGGGGTNGTYGSHMSGGARPQTAEVIKTFGERCPQAVTNNKQDRADYIVVLDHEGGKGFLRHRNKVAVFNHVSGDSVMSKSTLSLGGSVQEACDALTADWTAHSKEIRAAETVAMAAAEPKVMVSPVTVAMQQDPPKSSLAQLAVSSDPAGADIEIDGNFVGNTPSTLNVPTGQHQIAVKKSGFKPWERKMMVSGGQVNVNATLEAEAK